MLSNNEPSVFFSMLGQGGKQIDKDIITKTRNRRIISLAKNIGCSSGDHTLTSRQITKRKLQGEEPKTKFENSNNKCPLAKDKDEF